MEKNEAKEIYSHVICSIPYLLLFIANVVKSVRRVDGFLSALDAIMYSVFALVHCFAGACLACYLEHKAFSKLGLPDNYFLRTLLCPVIVILSVVLLRIILWYLFPTEVFRSGR